MKKRLLILICFVFLVSIFLVVPFSKAIFKSVGSTTGSATAADWDVAIDQTGISSSVSTTIGSANGTDYTLKLVSNSEVDVVYSITISNIPSGVDVKLNGGSFQTPSNGTYTFSNAGTINYTGSQEEVTRTITFKANNGASAVNAQQVTISVDFKQVQ